MQVPEALIYRGPKHLLLLLGALQSQPSCSRELGSSLARASDEFIVNQGPVAGPNLALSYEGQLGDPRGAEFSLQNLWCWC